MPQIERRSPRHGRPVLRAGRRQPLAPKLTAARGLFFRRRGAPTYVDTRAPRRRKKSFVRRFRGGERQRSIRTTLTDPRTGRSPRLGAFRDRARFENRGVLERRGVPENRARPRVADWVLEWARGLVRGLARGLVRGSVKKPGLIASTRTRTGLRTRCGLHSEGRQVRQDPPWQRAVRARRQ